MVVALRRSLTRSFPGPCVCVSFLSFPKFFWSVLCALFSCFLLKRSLFSGRGHRSAPREIVLPCLLCLRCSDNRRRAKALCGERVPSPSRAHHSTPHSRGTASHRTRTEVRPFYLRVFCDGVGGGAASHLLCRQARRHAAVVDDRRRSPPPFLAPSAA